MPIERAALPHGVIAMSSVDKPIERTQSHLRPIDLLRLSCYDAID